jgi:hypothetical protein
MPYQQARDYSTTKNAADVMRSIPITATRLLYQNIRDKGRVETTESDEAHRKSASVYVEDVTCG